MKKGFLLVFWGLIFTTFNFSIGIVDFFPNFIGFFFMCLGCKVLKEKNINFEKSYKVLIYITLLSFVEYILFKASLVDMPVTLALTYVVNLLDIYVIYTICRGIYELAEELQLSEFADLVKFRMNIYLAGTVILQVLIQTIYYLGNQIITSLIIIFAILVLVVRGVIIITVYQAKNRTLIEE